MQLPRVPRIPGVARVRVRRGITNVAGLAAFIRARLGEVGETLVPLLRRAEARAALPGSPGDAGAGEAVLEQARQVIVSAAAPFAPTSFARARLLRQMHACGLLSEDETVQAETLLGVAR
jgi:hypothetical protein